MTGHRPQHSEIGNDDHCNENPQQQDEFSLRGQIRLAGFIDQFGDFAHRAMHRQVLQLNVDRQPKHQTEKTKHQTHQKQFVTVDAEESDV